MVFAKTTLSCKPNNVNRLSTTPPPTFTPLVRLQKKPCPMSKSRASESTFSTYSLEMGRSLERPLLGTTKAGKIGFEPL
jgi:hypothetical protein